MSGLGIPAELLELEHEMLQRLFRLLEVERTLTARAAQRRGGTRAVQQLERERQRLGRELHTGVGQMLAAMRLQLELIGNQLPDPPEGVRQALGRISALSHDALDQTRSLSRKLYPPSWQALTLESAIRGLWELSGIPQRFEASLHMDPPPCEPGLAIKTLIYRGAQEAFSNVAQHAQAKRVTAALEVRNRQLILRVSDDGVGFDPARLRSAEIGAGIGLRSIGEQAAGLGGKLQVKSGPNGTTLELFTPLFETPETG